MKKYIVIVGLSFTLGAGTLLYSGTADDLALISESFATRNEQALQIDKALASENLERVKLQTELKRIEFEIDKRKLELELEALNELENAQKLALQEERANQKEWAWWVTFMQIFWMLILAVVLPLAALSVLIIKAFLSLRGQTHDQAE